MSDVCQLTNSRTVNLNQTVENETKNKIEYDKKIRLNKIRLCKINNKIKYDEKIRLKNNIR